jgi:hypothetical protein
MHWDPRRPALASELIGQRENFSNINKMGLRSTGVLPIGNAPVTPNFFLSPQSNEYAAGALVKGDKPEASKSAGSKSGGYQARR